MSGVFRSFETLKRVYDFGVLSFLWLDIRTNEPLPLPQDSVDKSTERQVQESRSRKFSHLTA
jgi:hypothetical protein